MKEEYIPGVCNIGPLERRMRRNVGIVGVAITVVLLIIFVLYSVALPWRLFIFITATGGAVGLLQSQLHFCARFGLSGLFNFSNDLKKQEGVEKTEYRRKDQRKAIAIIGGSIIIGAGVTFISILL